LKEKSTKRTLEIYPELKTKVELAEDRLLMALELAIAGNIIDYGTQNTLDVENELAKILMREQKAIKKEEEYIFNFRNFKKAVKKAKKILYLADNVGETVFDLLLLEEIKKLNPAKEIIYAVKEKPIINDALKEDAVNAGIDRFAEIISSGSDIPGTIITLCSEDFRKSFKKADIIISKGQGNFETFVDSSKPIYYLFMAKCRVVAKDVSCKVGDIILLKKGE
jgi:uncharacterized protein with ATP-grasp and redox domains